ncbi:hypothetical protein M406DRAFT_320878 [Cryphonectria parasitica EP155]|uniref:Uncharacterized protein n=1 Tax=Cryphonectria parasitica (strain ATCC 38755 / EP155) TaxID=660469 RepID=A0A9P5CRN9_CRYP1|nr:uncharacterized protein M406DRAFT_320878 [Cryphonectria parasitica EP155]KAF3768453.1 hypothetical protein M406DRAFT_320878 [Cryphonectria parasitica EP155]
MGVDESRDGTRKDQSRVSNTVLPAFGLSEEEDDHAAPKAQRRSDVFPPAFAVKSPKRKMTLLIPKPRTAL